VISNHLGITRLFLIKKQTLPLPVMKKPLYSVLVLLFGLLSCISEVRTEALVPDQLLGKWGGNQLAMVATENGIAFEFDCAIGEITERIVLKSDNSFSAKGTYRSLQGAAMVNAEAVNMPATYDGVLKGTRLELKVTLGAGSTVQSYVLEKGADPKLIKCL
jgi:hypothetical protein